MLKLLGNYIGVMELFFEMYGKLMFISDDLMWCYFDLLSFCSNEDIEGFKRWVG